MKDDYKLQSRVAHSGANTDHIEAELGDDDLDNTHCESSETLSTLATALAVIVVLAAFVFSAAVYAGDADAPIATHPPAESAANCYGGQPCLAQTVDAYTAGQCEAVVNNAVEHSDELGVCLQLDYKLKSILPKLY